uniref:Centrosomal protein of 131 kDa n=1 Tax=Trichobilharzia regenti TaxID=157069 RepID=A0AA85J1I1_TRIRE|nr:unnamed protein product [Trichobilharzia regenti]
MMSLTLKGSQINLTKNNTNSGRSSARTFSANCRTRRVNQEIGNPDHSSNDFGVLSGSSIQSLKAEMNALDNLFCEDDYNTYGNLNEANTTDSTALKKNERSSFLSSQNDNSVSQWLETHFHDQSINNAKWSKVNDDSVTLCSENRNEDFNSLSHAKMIEDSLDADLDEEFSNITTNRKKTLNDGNDAYYVDNNEKADTPPPCAVRPSSNSVNMSRPISSPHDDTDLLSANSVDHNRRNAAAITIQHFWRRHRRRHLAAEAAMRRLLVDQKRRLSEQNSINKGQPIHSVLQNRQITLQEKRKQQRQEAIKVLHENRPVKNLQKQEDVKGVSESNDSLVKHKEELNKNEPNILNKPSSPIRVNQYKASNSCSKILQNQENTICVKDELAHNGGYDDYLMNDSSLPVEQCITNLNSKESGSAVDNILQELKKLENADDSTYHTIRDNSVFATAEKQIPVKQSAAPNTWSEMVKDISRVLSEAEQDELDLHDSRKLCDSSRTIGLNGIGARPDSSISNHSSRIQSSSLGQSTAITNNHSQLTEENLRSHTKYRAQKELDRSISQCREKLATFCKSNYVSVNSKPQESTINNNSTIKRSYSAKTRNQSVLSPKLANVSDTNAKAVYPVHIKNPKNFSNTSLTNFSIQDSKVEDKSIHKNNGVQSMRNLYDTASFLDALKMPDSNDGDTIIENQTLLLELEKKEGQIKRLQRIIEHQRELSLRQLQDTQRDGEQRVESLKADYECTINRNYKLIDELIEEKKLLHTKCEELLEELKSMTKKSEDRLKTTEERHKVELRKLEAKHAAAEKVRREKWEAEKAKHFKEVTIRGMENEVAQMIANHKAEVAQLRQTYAEQIQAADVRAFQAYTNHIEELRQTLIKEKEEACSKEREIAEQRLNQTLTEERSSLEAHRRRLLNEISDERERLSLTASKQKEEMDTLRQNLELALTQANKQHKEEMQQLKADLNQRHKDEIAQLNQRNLAERAAWEGHTKSLLESQYTARETMLREQFKKERDRLLESAVHRLEAEANEARQETDRQAELKIKRVREKFQTEIEELERSEKQAMEKYCQMKTQFLDKEHEADRLRSQLTQKDQELTEVRVLYEKLNQERQNISDVIRQEFADRLVLVEEENRSIKRELAESRARAKAEHDRHEKEIEAVKKLNNSEIETVHQKLKELMKKKDEKLVMLRETLQNEIEKKERELDAANQRAQHLEELMDQQRKQFLHSNY